VTSRQLLVIVAMLQGTMLVALMVLILTNRWIQRRRRAALLPRRAVLDAAMRGWALGEVGPELVGRALEALPTDAAVEALVGWASRLPGERWPVLAAELERRPWAARVRAGATSRRWWKRLQAARFLSVVATAADAPLLVRLVGDPHPAVHIAAAAALERTADARVVTAALERLPDLGSPVQAYYASMLRHAHGTVVPLLLERLTRVYDPALPRYAEFAGRLSAAGLRDALTTLATHRNPEVRVQVARALGAFPHPESVTVLGGLATDAAWEVRAQATRALGRIGDPATLAVLAARLVDAVWWVRLRAALALMRLGPAGRDALLAAEIGPDPDARYVARLILGLSSQALAEFAA
jgi:hypothetical protein